MCKLCESAAAVEAAARTLTDACDLTGNKTGLRRARQFRVERSIPEDMQQQLDRLT